MAWESEQEAQRVSAALDQILGDRSAKNPKLGDGAAPGLVAGVLGVFYRGERVHCIYDPALLDPDRLRQQLGAEVGESVANRVVFLASPNSATRLAEVLRRIRRRDWIPAGASFGYAVSLDMSDGMIDMEVDASAFDDVRGVLEELGAGLIRLSAGGPFRRE